MSNKWCWESLDSFNSVCVKTNYWRSLDIYLLLSFPKKSEKGTLVCAWCLWPWLQKNVHPYQHVYWSTLWRGVTKHQDLIFPISAPKTNFACLHLTHHLQHSLLLMVSFERPRGVSVLARPPASLNLAPESFSYLMSPISPNPPHK